MIGQTVADVWRQCEEDESVWCRGMVEMSRYGYSLAREMRTQVECEDRTLRTPTLALGDGRTLGG